MKLHNLLSLTVKDLEIAPCPETSGSNLLLQHQKLVLDHFDHKNTAVLPEDVIQRLLHGVNILKVLFSEVLMIASILSFQLTLTLELALHLKSKVIRLKQDALRLMNIALVGTACQQILTLFEFALGYCKE